MAETVRWPLARNRIRRGLVSNTFGMVRKHADGTPKPHQGWDFYAEYGTPCYAIASGEVVYVGERGDFGLVLVHSFSFEGQALFAAYAHLSQADLKNGPVQMGTQIGLTGNSGNAKNLKGQEQHLHFEVRTVALPGLGLGGRISPIKVFGICPLQHEAVYHGQSSLLYNLGLNSAIA